MFRGMLPPNTETKSTFPIIVVVLNRKTGHNRYTDQKSGTDDHDDQLDRDDDDDELFTNNQRIDKRVVVSKEFVRRSGR